MLSICVVIMLLNISAASGGILPIGMTAVLEGESRTSKVTVSYKGKMSFTQVLEFGEAAKRVEDRAHWEGEGAQRYLVYTRIEKLNNNCEFKHVFTFLPGKLFKMKNYENTMTAEDGELVRHEFYNFNSKTMKYPDVMAHPFTLDLALRTFDLKIGARRYFHLWLSPTTVFKMETVVTGVEEIGIPNGNKVKCWRIEMTPDFADAYGAFVNRIIRPLVPEFLFWVRCEAPHFVVKYNGPLGQVNPVGGPTETQELINYSPGKGG